MTPEAERELLIAMCKAHDREDAAQTGEPSPWDLPNDDATIEAIWVESRVDAMREALAALAANGLQVEQGWQETTKAPPPEGTTKIMALSLSYDDGKTPIVLTFFKYNGLAAWRDWDTDPYPLSTITHWRPLPAAPSRAGSGDKEE